MLITAVKLENAKSYDNALVEFTPGVNAIVGHNGAGKSTILEAVGLAIFDYLSYTQSEFVRADARTATVTVTLESNLDERLYDVVRRVGGVNLHYVHDPEIGTRLCEGKADVLAFVREHLGVESTADLSSLFRDAVGVAQGTFTAAFLGTPSQRKGVFDPLLQVEDYRKAVELLRQPARLLNERRQALEVSIAQLRGRLESLPLLEQAVRQREHEMVKAEGEATQARTLLETATAQRRALESVRTELVDLRAEQSQKQERRHAAVRELTGVKQSLADAQAAHKMVEEHESGYERYLLAQERQKELDVQLRERQRLESERAGGDKAVAVAETELNQLQQDFSVIDAAAKTVERLADAIQQQNELESQLEQARQDAARLRDVDTQVSSQRGQLERLTATTENLKSALERSGELEARAAILRTEEEQARQAIEQLRDEGARLQTEGEAVKEQTSALEDADTAYCPVCEQPLSQSHRDEMLERNVQRLEGFRGQYREVQGQVKSLQGQLANGQNQLQQVDRDLRELPRSSELERLDNDAQLARRALDGLLKQQAELAGSDERIDALQGRLAELGNPKSEHELARHQVVRREAVTASMQETFAKMDALRLRLSSMQAELGRYANLDQEMDACAAELQTCEEAYRIVLGNRRLAVTVEERTADVHRLHKEEQRLAEEVALLSRQVEETSARFDEDAYEEVSTQEQNLRGQLGASEARIEMLQRQQEIDRASIAVLRLLQNALADAEGNVQAVTEKFDTLDTIRKLLGQAGPYVTRVLIRQISDNARQYFSDIMQDHTRHLAWNEDYGVTLEVDGHTRQFSQLSGGEQMTAALAIRLALLRELSSIDVAFFDEPTANLDEFRRESLARQILEIKGFRQLFVISHDDTFEQSTQNLIRVERVNGISSVTTD